MSKRQQAAALPDARVPEAAAIPEVSVAEGADILKVNRRTILRLIHQGLLRYRSVALPTSLRPQYRIPLADIMELRNDYKVRAPSKRAGRRQPESPPDEDLRLLGFM
jgi:hypothetical protein